MADFIDWGAISNASQGSPTYAGIRDVVTAPRGSFREQAGAEITPLMQPGQDPYLQQAINEIVRQGKESKARSISDVTTEAQRRGISGSSIESGDIAETSRQMELGQQGQITNILAGDAATKRTQMIDFLTKAYGMDYATAMGMADNLAQLMGQEMGRQTQLQIAEMTADAYKNSKPGLFETLAPAAASILGGPAGAAAINLLK